MSANALSFDPTFVWGHAGPPGGDSMPMLRVSIVSAHLLHPTAAKVCLVPAETADDVARGLCDLQERFGCRVETVAADVPPGDDLVRSRWLKIILPTVIRRDCLYLDSDTLVVRPLDFSAAPPSPVAAALNRDGLGGGPFSSESWVRGLYDRCAWEWPVDAMGRYRNSGVIAFRHGDEAVEFSRAWMRNWSHFRAATALHFDQPAFNHTGFETGVMGLLPAAWNSPVGVLPQTAAGASVFHYYASIGSTVAPHTLLGHLIDLDRAGRLPAAAAIRRALASRRPFVAFGASVRECREARQWMLYALALIVRIPSIPSRLAAMWK